MPGLVPGIDVFLFGAKEGVDAGTWASGSDAVPRTAIPGHDGKENQPALSRTPARRNFCGSTASPSILVS
jgi:hypothetical protein